MLCDSHHSNQLFFTLGAKVRLTGPGNPIALITNLDSFGDVCFLQRVRACRVASELTPSNHRMQGHFISPVLHDVAKLF